MANYEASVNFRVLGKFESATIVTDNLGFSPTRTRLAGEPINPRQISRPIARVKRSIWEYEVKPKRGEEVEDMILRILKKVSLPKLQKLRSRLPDIDCGFTYVVFLKDRMPAIFFSEDTIEKLAAYRMYVNVDIIQVE